MKILEKRTTELHRPQSTLREHPPPTSSASGYKYWRGKNLQSGVAWQRGGMGERAVNDQEMEEDEMSEKLPLPPTKQYCPLLTFSWVISRASSLPVTFLTDMVSTRASWEETSRQSVCKLPRLGGFRNDELVRVGEEDIKKVEDIVTTDFIKASIDNDKESIVLLEIKSIVIVSDGTAKLTLQHRQCSRCYSCLWG